MLLNSIFFSCHLVWYYVRPFISMDLDNMIYFAIQEDQTMAARLATTMSNSLKGRPVQVHIIVTLPEYQNKNLYVMEVFLLGSYISRKRATTICCTFSAYGGTKGMTFLVITCSDESTIFVMINNLKL